MKVVAHITDLHTDDFLAKKYKVDTRKNIEAALSAIAAAGIVDVVLTGDLGEVSSVPWLLEAILGRGMNTSVLLGNHDKAEAYRALDAVVDLFHRDGLYYSKFIEGTLCLFLDSSSAVIGREQFRWLEGQVAKARGRQLVIFVHHPILDCGGTLMDRRYPLTNRDTLVKLLGGLDLDVSVFCGHYHTNHEQILGRITQYVTPSLMLQFKQDAEAFEVEDRHIAYRRIEFDSGRIHAELVRFR